MKTEANFLKINFHDIAKGVIVAVLTVILGGLLPIIESGALPTVAQLKIIGLSGATAGIAYILKNWLTNSDDQFLRKEKSDK